MDDNRFSNSAFCHGPLHPIALSRPCLPLCWRHCKWQGPFAPQTLLRFIAVGSEEAPIEGLASVRHSNGACSFPALRFHEWPCEVRGEGISETRLNYLVLRRVDLLLLTFEHQMIG